MSITTEEWRKPVFFRRNRVFRVYLGGKLFHDFLGDPAEDGNLPEEWVCSAVRALNSGHTDPLEGISLREEDGMPFHTLLASDPEHYLGERKELGVLVKYLDSAIRLPMQVHPTRAFSREYFGSPYGKAESWLILATRPDACIYFGFSREVTKEEFAAAVERSETDPNAMTEFVNRVPVKTGDVFFVDAGMIHAIGAGCLILEVQEPTDFTVQPEYWCGDYHLNQHEMYLTLDPDIALDCFHFHKFGPETVERGRKVPKVLYEKDGIRAESLIGPEDTTCFSMDRFLLENAALTLTQPASIWICAEGEGVVTAPGYSRKLKMGDYFFLPAGAAGDCRVEGSLTLICCMGGE